MVLRVCITLFWFCGIFFTESCASKDEVKTLFLTNVSTPELQVPAENQFSKKPEKIATSSCKPPVTLQSLISAPPFLPILFAKSASSLLADKQCGKDAQRFLNEFADGTYWAAQMFDASTKVPEGVLFGNKAHYGNFDECYTGGTENFGTRYCLIDIAYNRSHLETGNFPLHTDVRENNCTWDYFKVKPRIWALDSSSLRVALCAPSSCTSKDIELCLAKALEKNFKESASRDEFPLSVSVRPINCQARDERRTFTLANRLFCAFVIILCTVIGVGSWLHRSRPSQQQENTSLAVDIVDCFSVQRNIESFRQEYRTNSVLAIPDLFRITTSITVITAHHCLQYAQIPTINAKTTPVDNDHWITIGLMNITVGLEPTLAISAILASIAWLNTLNTGKPLSFWSIMICRYIRLTPPYAIVILIYIFVMPNIGSGALWRIQVEQEADICRNTWWHNLLYINNYMGDRFCMYHSWHLAVDVQAYIILFVVVTCLWKLPRRVNYIFLIFLVVILSCLNSYVTYVNKLPPTILPQYVVPADPTKPVEDPQQLDYFMQFYIKTHYRITPFILGAIGAMIILDMEKINLRLSQSRSFLLVALSLLGHISLHVLVVRYVWGIASDLEVALYGGFHRTLYTTLAIVIIVTLKFTENLNGLWNAVHPPWLQRLNKLSYGIYLCHPLVIMYNMGSVRAPKTVSLFNLVSDFCFDYSMSIIISMFLWLVAESPSQHLLNLAKKRAARRTKTD